MNTQVYREAGQGRGSVVALGLLSVAGLVAALAVGPLRGPGPSALALAVATVALDLASVPLGTFGRFSTAVACLVGLAVMDGGGAAVPALIAFLSIALRGILTDAPCSLDGGPSSSVTKLQDALADLVPSLATVMVAAAVRSALGLPAAVAAALLVYVPLQSVVALHFARGLLRPELIEWLFVDRALRPLRATLVLAGGGLALLAPLGPGAVLVVVPALWALERASADAVYRARSALLEMVRTDMEKSLRGFDSARDATEEKRRELEDVIAENRAIEVFARHLAISEAIDDTVDLILAEATRKVSYRTVAVFLEEEGRLVLARCQGPLSEKVEAATRMGVSEPIVEKAWKIRSTLRHSDTLAEAATPTGRARGLRLFEGERSAVAVPLQDQGVLYVGQARGEPYSDEDVGLLAVVAGHGGLALQSTRRLLETREALAQVVEANRRLEESQAQLVQSSKMAAVGQLAAGVAHEINSPLGAIVLGIDAAIGQIDSRPAGATKRLERARAAAERAQRIIEKLLVYSRSSSGERRSIDPLDLVRETADFLEHQLSIGQYAMDLDLAPTPPILGCRTELQQVLVNLVLNARDALEGRPPSERRIRLFTRLESTDTRQDVCIGVQDRGEGIPPDVLPRIFEPFFTGKPVGKGTGLGLSVSHQLVEAHGGRFDVVSTPGEGSTFIVRLPLLSVAASREE